MHIVFLLDSYFPHRNPSANCADIYIQKLKRNHDISIISPSTTIQKALSYNVGGIDIYYITNYWNSLRSWCNYHINAKRNIGFYKFILFLVRIYGVLLSFFLFPTRFAWLIEKYVNCVESIIEKKNVDVIFSVSDPICAHLAAQKIKKKYPQIRWITYTTDPFAFSERNKKKSLRVRQKYMILEKSIYDESDVNIFTQELYDFNLKEFDIIPVNNFAFPYVLSDFENLKSPDCKIINSSKPTFLYAGALMKKIRHPEFALFTLSKLKDYEVFFYTAGDCEDILQRYESDNIHINSLIPREKYMNLITKEADFLINIGNINDLQSPSKFLELISTGKPIVNFYKKKDANYNMAERYPLGINIGEEDEDSVNKLLMFCKENIGKKLSFNELVTIFPENVLESQLQRLEYLLDQKNSTDCSRYNDVK